MKTNGMVSLIGAGCGAKDLITVRGLECLRKCDAVVYDDLIDAGLLDEVPADAQRIYMGKRLGKHSAPQQEISQMLVKLAQQGKHVARLKGGDPFVFGRGGEESLALQQAGIAFEEIPGISSCIAIPAQAGIPVTHRGLSRSFHVITAHTATDCENDTEKMKHLAALDGTLVFLMGLGRLEALAESMMQAGKSANTPAAVISGGNAPHPMTVRGTLQTIAPLVRQANVQAPAVIVVGEVAALELISPLVEKPLAGVRVGITGTQKFVQKLDLALKQQGAQTQEVSCSQVMPLHWESVLERNWNEPCWLVFTSANGVRIFFDTLRREKKDLRQLARCQFAVIGKSTGEVLSQYGIQPDLCPDVYTSEALAQELCKKIQPGESAVLLRAKQSAAILPQMLREQGISVQDVALYDVKTVQTEDCALTELDYLTFASAGGVRQFFQKYKRIPDNITCVCIGPVTAKEFARYDPRPCLIAEQAEVSSLVQTICLHRKNK